MNRLLREQVDDGALRYYEDNVNLLNEEQANIFNRIREKVNNGHSGFLFIDAPGGTGKTFLLNVILSYVRSLPEERGIALAVAGSGIAATLLKLGRTAHSQFKLPLRPTEDSMLNISSNDPKAELIRRAKIIVWDEASMTHRFLYEALDRTLRDIVQCDELFGGKLLLLAGDFRQTLPVVRNGRAPDFIGAALTSSILWQSVERLELRTNMRSARALANGASSEQVERLNLFCAWLLRIGNGSEVLSPAGDEAEGLKLLLLLHIYLLANI